MIVFLSPKQSEIEESSLESLRKSRIQGVWDPAHYTRLPPLSTRLLPPLHPVAPLFTSGCRHFTSGCRRFYPDVLHPKICYHHSTRMYCIRNYDAGWERKAFQLPRSDISGSTDSAHPEDFTAILHSVAVFS